MEIRLTIASLLLVAAPGCVAPPPAPVPMELRFAENHGLDADRRRFHALAETIAFTYVKVVITQDVSARTGRDADTDGRVISGASGIIVDSVGYVVTAAHIARHENLQAHVTTFDGSRHPARIVHVDPGMDLALLKILDGDTSFQAARPARGTEPDQPVLALGTPGNRPGAMAVGRVIRPVMEARVRYGDYGFERAIELRLRVEPGYSGGPVFDTEGRLVGMIAGFDLRASRTGRYVSTGTAYAVPAADLMAFVRRWAGDEGNIRAVRFVLQTTIHKPTGD